MVLKMRKFLLILFIAVTLAALGGGLIGGLAVYSLGSLAEPTPTPPQAAAVSEPAPTADNAPFQLATTDFSTTITEAVKKVSPTVVTVLGQMPQSPFTLNSSSEVSGSGVIISPEGYIITNNHVVEGTEEVAVILADGEELPAEIVGTDRFSDLAVLKIDGDQVQKTATLGNSDNLSSGETVIAIGSPLGKFKNTVTVGVVSATDRMLRISENYQMEGLIQTDAAINQGNSGGPLVNLAGEVIGINTLIVRGGTNVAAEGLGFAIPSNMTRAIAGQIIENGYVARPFLGIRWEWVTPGIAEMYNLPVEWGAFISAIEPNTPADQAGLREGDIIISFGDRALNENNPFVNALYDHAPGETVPLIIQRGDEQLELEVTLDEQPKFGN